MNETERHSESIEFQIIHSVIQSSCEQHCYTISGEQFHKDLLNNNERLKILHETSASYRNFYVKEAYETIKFYCNKTTELNNKKFRCIEQHAYINTLNFTRIIRNCMTHLDGIYEISWPLKNLDFVEWNGYKIKKGMKGSEIKISSQKSIELQKN